MHELRNKINETVKFIKEEMGDMPQPDVAIILGTGLGNLSAKINEKKSLEYRKIPHFSLSTVKSHKGEMVFGKIGDKNVVAMEGRFHYYEGYSLSEVTYPVRVARALGAKTLVVSNAAGGMNPKYKCGDLMAVADHINFTGLNPLIGPNDETLGPRIPDFCDLYDPQLVELACKIAKEEGISMQKGVYIGVTGPNLETKAEYRFFQVIGADAVGMSTVPEVIVAKHAGFRIFGISVITDICLPETLKPCNLDEIIKTANGAEPKLTKIIYKLIERL
ncbi:MAG TPA: purine-nucleoside phosphorylase [Candidatus Omnitrophota bacterium]|nr:purine-nucleoside phosphorylase [Candidatus Omnitrophota bacterium]HOX10252.1 purine-nucleoside phosphorylase [Candidatus Omnitrophota bacterium]HRZ67069.1 purine-nucleoside phosphorylase [Candidatus Omnitrophota bacterium]